MHYLVEKPCTTPNWARHKPCTGARAHYTCTRLNPEPRPWETKVAFVGSELYLGLLDFNKTRARALIPVKLEGTTLFLWSATVFLWIDSCKVQTKQHNSTYCHGIEIPMHNDGDLIFQIGPYGLHSNQRGCIFNKQLKVQLKMQTIFGYFII